MRIALSGGPCDGATLRADPPRFLHPGLRSGDYLIIRASASRVSTPYLIEDDGTARSLPNETGCPDGRTFYFGPSEVSW